MIPFERNEKYINGRDDVIVYSQKNIQPIASNVSLKRGLHTSILSADTRVDVITNAMDSSQILTSYFEYVAFEFII